MHETKSTDNKFIVYDLSPAMIENIPHSNSSLKVLQYQFWSHS